MIKLIASDIDGTLLPYGQKELNPRLFPLIERLWARGVLFCPASGRQYHSLRRLFAPSADHPPFQHPSYPSRPLTTKSREPIPLPSPHPHTCDLGGDGHRRHHRPPSPPLTATTSSSRRGGLAALAMPI